MANTIYEVKLPGQALVSSAPLCGPCIAQELQAQTAAVQATYFNSDGSVDITDADAAWEGPLVFEGQFTGDGRFIDNNAITWDESQFPMPLRYAQEDIGAHGGAQVIGLIQTLTRKSDGAIWGTGIIDTSTEMGATVYHGLQKGTIKGVSVDMDSVEVEVRVKKEIYDAFQDLFSEEPTPPAEPEVVDGYVKVYETSPDDEVLFITGSRMRAATLVDIPAFAKAYISLTAGGEPKTISKITDLAMVAAAPLYPSEALFRVKLTEPTPITVTDDGQIFGHIALWGTCHTGLAGQCVTPPYSATNYGWFRTGALLTAEGTEIPVGHITLATGHAPVSLSAGPAVAHYDDTGTCVADVASGEDSHGIWISGAIRPGVTDEQLRELRSAPMSGDWRTVGGNLELVAILAVNVPGFPVPRTKALVASGRTATLVRPVGRATVTETVKEPSKAKVFADTVQAITVKQWAFAVGE